MKENWVLNVKCYEFIKENCSCVVAQKFGVNERTILEEKWSYYHNDAEEEMFFTKR